MSDGLGQPGTAAAPTRSSQFPFAAGASSQWGARAGGPGDTLPPRAAPVLLCACGGAAEGIPGRGMDFCAVAVGKSGWVWFAGAERWDPGETSPFCLVRCVVNE